MIRTRHRFVSFLRWLGALSGIYLAAAAALTLTVDPWRSNHSRLSLPALDPAREISDTVRVGKAALADRGDWETAILGSSRMEIGIDPRHPAFAGSRTVNLAMAAALVLEIVPVGNYLIDRNPGLKTLIVGIEPGDLCSDLDRRGEVRFFESPFADHGRSIERSINQVIGGRAVLDSIDTLRRHRRGEQPHRTALGHWVSPSDSADIRSDVMMVVSAARAAVPDQWAQRPQVTRPHKLELLAGFIRRARQAGIELHLVVPPQHALRLIHPHEDRPRQMGWEADLQALVAICREENARPAGGPPVKCWNFQDFNEITTEELPLPGAPSQRMRGWFDLGHFRTELGGRMLATMFGGRPGITPDHAGVCLSEGSWEAHRAAWLDAHARYCATHRADVEWWRGLLGGNGADKQQP